MAVADQPRNRRELLPRRGTARRTGHVHDASPALWPFCGSPLPLIHPMSLDAGLLAPFI